MTPVCELCGGIDHAPMWEVDGIHIVRCLACRLVFVRDAADPEALRALYDDGYFNDASTPGYDGYPEAETRKRHHFGTLLDRLEEMIAPGALLEVGCAYGFFLDEARRRGWAVRGIEPSRVASAHARTELGLDVEPGPLAALRPGPASVDAVVMWDVIEHLPDPRQTLEAAWAALRPGGIIGMSTGDVESLSARIQGRDWSLLTPPWHLFYFSRRTLTALLSDVGFDVVHMDGDGVVGVDPAAERRRIRGPLARVLGASVAIRVARRLGAGSTMIAWARKPIE